MTDDLTGLFRGRNLILLDFDGPVCAAFGAHGAGRVSRSLRAFIESYGFSLDDHATAGDPLAALRKIAQARPDLAYTADAELRRLEAITIADAIPTPGAEEFLRAAARSQRTVAIVSNNSGDAIQQYLAVHQLRSVVTIVRGRPSDPARMKPDPWPLRQVLNQTSTTADKAVMIGDSAADVHAAHALHIPCIGLANKPGKQQRLHDAGADAVAPSMDAIRCHLEDTH